MPAIVPENASALLRERCPHGRLVRLVEQLDGASAVEDPNLEALEDELARARVIDEADLPPDVVTMNSEVVVVDVETREELRVRVVFPSAADIERGRISVLAPVGLAVLGSREGDELKWQTPSRIRHFRIERVTYQPEANGDRI
jgi:regulator of nucleoside diphosphate kinase